MEQGCCRVESQPHSPQFSPRSDGFRFQRFGQSPRHMPSLSAGPAALGWERPCHPHPEGAVAGTGRGLPGFTRPPGAWVLGSRGCSFGVTSCFQKVERNIRKPTRRNSPPTRGTIPTPLPFSFLPSPLPPPAPSPSHPSAYNPSPHERKGSGRKDEVSVFVSQPQGSFWAQRTTARASRLSGKGPRAGPGGSSVEGRDHPKRGLARLP